MNEKLWNKVDEYIGRLVEQDDALRAALHDSANAGLPPIHVSPAQGKLLMLLAQIQQARSILEIGTLGGYSTIWLGRGLTPGGDLLTLEVSSEYADVAERNIARAGLESAVEIRVGPAMDTLKQLIAECHRPFDLIFIDADKARYADYLEASLRLSRTGTLVIADNVVRKGAVIDARSTDTNISGMRRFFERLQNEPRISATAIQTVGSKGYDGFAIGRVTSRRHVSQ
jgi:predicted O-methyltransferase YrrM